MIKDSIKAILEAGYDADAALFKSGLTKEEVKSLADAGDLDASIVLLLGEATHQVETYTEPFEDEDTHEVVDIERHRPLDSFVFASEPKEREALAAKIAGQIPNMDSERLTQLRILLYGEISVLPYLEELVKRGDKNALAILGDYYANGEESAGSQKDKERAREYYNQALAAGWDEDEFKNAIFLLDYVPVNDPLNHPQDLADNFDPREATIMISGHPLYLDQIEKMVEDLTKAHGTPGNECGLFVPLQFVFKTLGFDWVDNTGNLMRIARHANSVLTLELECNPQVDDALVEAFRKAYPKLTVETL